MMKKIYIFAFLLAITSCGGGSNLGGGTSVSNPPTVPVSNLTIDLDTTIAETALGDTSSAQSLVKTQPAGSFATSGPASYWSDVVLEGPVAQARLWRRSIQNWFEHLNDLVSADDNFDLSTSPTYLLRNLLLIDQRRDWSATIRQRGDLIEVTARRVGEGDITAQALLETDADGKVVRGQFAFVGPETFGFDNVSGVRFFGMAFDLSDPSVTKLTTTADLYNDEIGYFVVNHLSYECLVDQGDCRMEVVLEDQRAPHRDLSSRSLRLNWREDTAEICVAPISYSDSGAEIGDTQEFLGGATAPGEDDVSENTCLLAEPYWAARGGPPRLPKRFDDDNSGGFADELYGSGTSLTPWRDKLSDSSIDDWLLGEFE